jgi:hypothetical protein
MKNLSLPLFRLDGGIRLRLETCRTAGMARLLIHDDADTHTGTDICVSVPLEHAANIRAAVEAFNRALLTEASDAQ